MLIELVDIINGIEYNVPIDMEYDDNNQNLHIDLKAGTQKLNGNQVEQLVRFRHNNDGSTYPWDYGIEDYGRMKTQRGVIKTIAKQTIQLKHVWKVGEIVDTIGKNIETNLDLGMVKDYIPYGMEVNVDSIVSEQLPGVDDEILPVDSSSKVWFFFPDEEKTKEAVDKVFGREKVVDETNTNEVKPETNEV